MSVAHILAMNYEIICHPVPLLSPRFCLCDGCGCAKDVDAIANLMESTIDAGLDHGVDEIRAVQLEMVEAFRRSGRILPPDLLPSGVGWSTMASALEV